MPRKPKLKRKNKEVGADQNFDPASIFFDDRILGLRMSGVIYAQNFEFIDKIIC